MLTVEVRFEFVAELWRHSDRRPPPHPGRRAHAILFTMDSRIGLDYIVENPDYTAKLAGGMSFHTLYVSVIAN